MVRRGAGAGDALDLGEAALRDAVGLVEQARHDVGEVGIVAHGARGLSGQQAQHRHRHVGQKFRPDRLPDLRDLGRFDRSLVQRRAQPRDPLAGAVVAFADQEPVALGRQVGDDAGRDDFVGRKHHAADDALLRDRGAQPAAGIEESRDRAPAGASATARYRTTRECRSARTRRRYPSPSSGCRLVGKTGQAGGLQRADHDVLRAQLGRIARCLHLGLERRHRRPAASGPLALTASRCAPAHHAGDVMSRQRQPHRKMAADGARTENANPHG